MIRFSVGKRVFVYGVAAVVVVFFGSLSFLAAFREKREEKMGKSEIDFKDIYLAGGCFWGVEAYFSRINGVIETEVGYANGNGEDTGYHELQETGHAETVKITYDPRVISLEKLLNYFFEIIDPLSVNRQGNDRGTQYRTGIYYTAKEDMDIIEKVMKKTEETFNASLATEREPLRNYVTGEEYHQKYLDKNPGGYCHIDLTNIPDRKYVKPDDETLKGLLTELQYNITQKNATEPPFRNEYWDNEEEGIYVDIVTGQPIFSSVEKYDSGSGWPSFTRPINDELIKTITDYSAGMERIEVRSKLGDSHLGHVFNDGPKGEGGLRYCINSGALRFIPLNEMEKQGYKQYIPLVEK